MTLGNGLTETTAYNDRLQHCLRDLNSTGSYYGSCTDSQPGGTVLDLGYGYNAGSSDNGDVMSIAATGQQSYSRAFGYDPLNRLASMTGTGGSCLGLSWSYDAWGNRTAQNATSGTCDTSSLGYNSNNQIVTPSRFQYDAAGDLTGDGSQTYTYDAAGRITAVDGGSTATYVYDAFGRRARKTVGGVNTDYIRDKDGQVLAEMDPNWSTGYAYFGGRLLAEYRNSTTYFVTQNQIGSSSLLTNVTGGVADCNVFYPYGEQDSSVCSTTNTITHKFTGKERDSESGLDYFGARYYGSSLGRFMTPDWSKNPEGVPYANYSNPQSLNLYSYLGDNPLSGTDPTGHVQCENDIRDTATHGCVTPTSPSAQQQNPNNEAVGNTTVGDLSKVLTNEIGSLSTPKGGDPKELQNGSDALANALINNANKKRPNEVAPDTGTAATPLAKAMQDAYTNRANGGADPVQGRTFYGTSHIPPSRLHSRPIGSGRQSVFQSFGPFKDSTSRLPTYIYIYNDPGH